MSFLTIVQQPFRKIYLIILMASLMACGGGGSGGSDSGATTGGGSNYAVYTGSEAAMDVNQNTAVDAAIMAVGGRAVISIAEEGWIDTPSASSVRTSTETISGSNGGSAKVKITVENQTVVVTITYNDFNEDGVIASGKTVQRSVSRVNTSPGFIYSSVSGSFELIDFRVRSTDIDGVLNGTIESFGGNSQKLTANIVAVDLATNQSVKLENYSIDFSTIIQGANRTIASTISGRVLDSDLGAVTIRGLQPIEELEYYSPLELVSGRGNGLLEIVGADKTMRLMAVSPKYVGLSFDDDNDGRFEQALRVKWAVLNEIETISMVDQGAPPVANPGVPFFSYVDTPARLHGYYSHDPDNQFLTQSWQLVHAPIGSNQTKTIQLGAEYEFIPDLPGDYFFKLVVSDGTQQQQSSIKLVVGPQVLNGPTETMTKYAGLEVTIPDSGQLDYEISAQSTAWYEDIEEESVSWRLDKPFASNTLTELRITSDSFITQLAPDNSLGELLKVSYTSRHGASETTFSNVDIPFNYSTIIDGDVSSSVQSMDFNSDGYRDLVLLVSVPEGNATQKYIDIWFGDNSGNYQRQIRQLAGYSRLVTGDLNNDGRLDIVTSSEDGLYISIQNANGQLETPVFNAYASCVGNIRRTGIGDFNGDERDDLLMLNACDSELIVQLQDTMGGLGMPSTYTLSPNGVGQIVFGHLNSDNLIDVAYGSGYGPGKLEVRLNNGSGLDLPATYTNVGLSNAPGVAAGDFTGDGRTDLVQFDGQYIYFYEQTAAGGLELYAQADNAHISTNPAVYFADVDNDGDIDMVQGSSYNLDIYLHQSNSFTTVKLGSDHVQNWPEAITVMDYNQDGTMDIIVPSQMITVFLGGLSPVSQAVP